MTSKMSECGCVCDAEDEVNGKSDCISVSSAKDKIIILNQLSNDTENICIYYSL